MSKWASKSRGGEPIFSMLFRFCSHWRPFGWPWIHFPSLLGSPGLQGALASHFDDFFGKKQTLDPTAYLLCLRYLRFQELDNVLFKIRTDLAAARWRGLAVRQLDIPHHLGNNAYCSHPDKYGRASPTHPSQTHANGI